MTRVYRFIYACLLLLMAASGHATQPQGNIWQNATRLLATDTFQISRTQRFVVTELEQPHRVVSTSYINGGETTAIRYLVNHQSMAAKPDYSRLQNILDMGRQSYHDAIAQQLGVNSEHMVLMGTAANMQELGHDTAQFGDLRVDALVTAGVKGNAMRAGNRPQTVTSTPTIRAPSIRWY